MARVNLEIIGKDNGATAAVKGVTGSLVSAGIILGALKEGWKLLTDTIGKSIEAFKETEQVEAKLKVQVGENISAFTDFATVIQQTTTYGDEAILMMQSLGMSMGISSQKINEASKQAIGLSEAFGIDLTQSMKMVAQAQEGNYTMMSRYIPALKNATTESQKLAIMQKVTAQGFEMAEAKGQTLTGMLEQLKNINDDNYEQFGRIISIVGKDFVSAMKSGALAINDFLSNKDNIAAIGAAFKVLSEVGKQLGGTVWEQVKKTFGDLGDKFKTLLPDTKETNVVFYLLAGAAKLVGMALSIVIKLIGIFGTQIFGVIKVVKEAIEVLGAFWDAASGKDSWSNVLKAVKDVGKVYADVYTDLGKQTKDLIVGTIQEFQSLPNGVKGSAEELSAIYAKSQADIKAELDKSGENIVDSSKKNFDDMGDGMNESMRNSMSDLKGTTEEGLDDLNDSMQEKLNEGIEYAIEYGQSLLGVIQEALGMIQEARDEAYETEQALMDEREQGKLDKVDAWIADELNKHGVKAQTRNQQLQQEVTDLQAKLGGQLTAEEKARIETQIKEKQDEITRNKILEEGEKKKAKIQKDAAKKATELKKQQFEENKMFAIANIWINAGLAVMGWWAGFASMGIPGIVLAAVMTATTLVMAGVQTGIVASQQFKGEQGGVIGVGGMSGDNVMLNANKGEALIRNDDYNALIDMAKSPSQQGGIYISNMTVVANNPQQFAEQMKDLQRYERGR